MDGRQNREALPTMSHTEKGAKNRMASGAGMLRTRARSAPENMAHFTMTKAVKAVATPACRDTGWLTHCERNACAGMASSPLAK